MNGNAGGVVFENVTKRYGGVTAVDRVSFRVEQGDLVTLLGPSGCGKTTTLRMVAGLEPVTEGRVLIEGTDVTLFNDPDMTSNGKYQIDEIQLGPNSEGPSPESLQQLAKTFHAAGRSQASISAALGIDTHTLDGLIR